MITLEALCNLVEEYNLSHTSLALFLKTTKSQIGMTLRCHRALPPHSEILLQQLMDILATGKSHDKAPNYLHITDAAEKESFRRRYNGRLLKIQLLNYHLQRKTEATEKANAKSKRELGIFEQILDMASATGDTNVHNHFSSKLYKRDSRIKIHGELRELGLKIQSEILAAEEAIIKKYMDELGS